MKNGDIVKLGTLKVDGTTRKMPTNPVNGGDCISSGSGNIEIVNTEVGKELQWIYVKHNNVPMLICDRCLVVNITWDTLNAANLIFGKEITIDGQAYKIRSLTGGKNSSDKNNEWDKIIAENTYNIGSGNEIWHWQNMYTWCQDTYSGDSSHRALRGYISASYWGSYYSNDSSSLCGFRPALEILNAAPLISGSDGSIGTYNTPFEKHYTITESDKESFSIEEKLDETVLRRLAGQTDGSFVVAIDKAHWESISLGTHKIIIKATDVKGGESTRTWTFEKTNNPPNKPTFEKFQNGMRVDITNFEVEFKPQIDEEGDTQTFKLEIADDISFNVNKITKTGGLHMWNGNSWVPATECSSSNVGKKFKFIVTGLTPSTTHKYIRIGSTDAQGSRKTTYSNAVKVGTRNKLIFKTKPYTPNYEPSEISVTLNSVIDAKAKVRVHVTNNANDTSPVWEDMTSEFIAEKFHKFANKTKVNGCHIATKVEVMANDSINEISVAALMEVIKR